MVLSKKHLYGLGVPEFKETVSAEPRSYSWLTSLSTYLAKQEDSKVNRKKVAWIQELRQEQLDAGKVKTKRRIPGTGTKVITKVPYKDTKENRDANRVGKFYDVVSYENAQYDERVQTNMRRVKKRRAKKPEDGETKKKAPSLWILAMDQAKKDMNISGFVKVRKEVTDASNEDQVFEHKVYLRARHIHERLKAQKKAQEAAMAAAEVSPEPVRKKKSKKRKQQEAEYSDEDSEPSYSPKRSREAY